MLQRQGLEPGNNSIFFIPKIDCYTQKCLIESECHAYTVSTEDHVHILLGLVKSDALFSPELENL